MMNYPARLRGTRSSAFFALSAFGGVTFSVLGGYLLDQNMSYFRIIILLMAVSCFVYAFLFLKIPGSLLSERGKQFSLRSFTLLWQDRLFGSMIMAWFLLGFGNLMMIPLRVEYIANPIYGINASNEMVAIITIVIPSIAAILSTRVWGVLFDRIHFAVWRNGVNVCFVVSILIFFNTHALLWLFIASFIDGIARGGAFLGWSLWVTKIAPPDKIPQYMSIHTAATGIRGVLAPFLGFFLIYEIHPQYTSWIAVFLIVLSIIIFSFMYRVKRLASRH